MKNVSRRNFFKVSSITTMGGTIGLLDNKAVQAQDDEYQIFLPMVVRPPTLTSEIATILQKLHLDNDIINTIDKADPYIYFTGNKYKIDDNFNATSKGISLNNLTLLNQVLDLTNEQLSSSQEILDAHIVSRNREYTNRIGCSRSGTEFLSSAGTIRCI